MGRRERKKKRENIDKERRIRKEELIENINRERKNKEKTLIEKENIKKTIREEKKNSQKSAPSYISYMTTLYLLRTHTHTHHTHTHTHNIFRMCAWSARRSWFILMFFSIFFKKNHI